MAPGKVFTISPIFHSHSTVRIRKSPQIMGTFNSLKKRRVFISFTVLRNESTTQDIHTKKKRFKCTPWLGYLEEVEKLLRLCFEKKEVTEQQSGKREKE